MTRVKPPVELPPLWEGKDGSSTTAPTRRFSDGPFGTWGHPIPWQRRFIYRAGFDIERDFELQPGATQATWEIPSWAKSDGIVGDWLAFRWRRTWKGIPITTWRPQKGEL